MATGSEPAAGLAPGRGRCSCTRWARAGLRGTRVVSAGSRLAPEETPAALTGQGMKVIARGLVTANHTVPRLVPTGHSSWSGWLSQPLTVGGAAVSSGPPSSLFRRASSRTCPGPDPLHYLHFIVFGFWPQISYLLLFGSVSPAGHRVWCGMSLPEVLLCPCFSLDLRSCSVWREGLWPSVPGKQGPSVLRDHVGRAETLDPGQRPGQVFPACPWC